MRLLASLLHKSTCAPNVDPRRADYWAYTGLSAQAIRWVTGQAQWPSPMLCGCLPGDAGTVAWQGILHVDRDTWVTAGLTARTAAAWALDETGGSIRYVTHLDPCAVATWVLHGYSRWADLDPYDAACLRADGTYTLDTTLVSQ